MRHQPSGLHVLAAPLEPAFADQIGAAEMVKIVETLRKTHAYVIVDTPAYFNDVVLGLIEVSDQVLLVAGLDVPNIKNVKIGLQTLRLLKLFRVKVAPTLRPSGSGKPGWAARPESPPLGLSILTTEGPATDAACVVACSRVVAGGAGY